MAGTILTKKGIQLLVKLMATQGNLEFTRVSIGSGSLPKGYDPASMIDLINYKMDGVISRCSADNDVATITMQISSMGIETGFTMTEIGVFAMDPDVGEVLYSYLDLQEDPQYIYAEGGEAEKYIEIMLEVAIEESTKVTNYINPASLVTREEFDKELLDIKETFRTEAIDFDDTGEVEGINSFADFMSSFIKGTPIYKFLANLKAAFKYVLHDGKLVNNGMCETPGKFALDAAYGHTMTEQITQLYSDIADSVNVRWNLESNRLQVNYNGVWVNYPPSFVGNAIYLIQNGALLVPYTINRNGTTLSEDDGVVTLAIPAVQANGTFAILTFDKEILIDEPYMLVAETIGAPTNYKYVTISYAGVNLYPSMTAAYNTDSVGLESGAGKVTINKVISGGNGGTGETLKIKNLYLKRVRE